MHRVQSVTDANIWLRQFRGPLLSSLDGGGMDRHQSRQSPPFTIRLLAHEDAHGADASRRDPSQLLSLLPASYRTESDHVAAPAHHVAACVAKELDLRRLTRIHGWLWVAGRPMPPRPLHHQRLLSREIFVTEQMDMHF
ncbi:hypothetical protein F5883DRAFT_722659 [Diaporthe sp. PMI_573]|nr:hypothetical protein F5883DRAFT_722659 [Diaporthaceae sp. PMI_573]